MRWLRARATDRRNCAHQSPSKRHSKHAGGEGSLRTRPMPRGARCRSGKVWLATIKLAKQSIKIRPLRDPKNRNYPPPNSTQSSDLLAAMSTSVAYLRKRLADIGRHDLLQAADAGLVSVYACAEEAGLVRRREVLGNGSPNQAKRRAWELHKISKQTATPSEANFSQQPAPPKFSQGTRNGRPAMPDLGAALAEVEEMQRPLPRDHEPAPAAPPPEPERALPTHPAIPCTRCDHPQAAAALREILNVYVAATRGELRPTGSTLPRACCRCRVSSALMPAR
jgi:hypothetical protein